MRWAQLEAQKLFQEMLARTKAKEQQRRQAVRRAIQLGESVLATADDWERSELVGALLDARERIRGSPTMRLAARKRGEQHLLGSRPPPAAEAPPGAAVEASSGEDASPVVAVEAPPSPAPPHRDH